MSECLTLAHLTSAPLGQDAMESGDGLFVYKWENAGSKRCTQVSEIIHAKMLEYSSYTDNIGQMYHCDTRAERVYIFRLSVSKDSSECLHI